MTSKFSYIHKLQKNDVLNLIDDLKREDLDKIVLSLDKDILLTICKNSFTKSQLQEILYKSDISSKKIVEYLYIKDNKNIDEKENDK